MKMRSVIFVFRYSYLVLRHYGFVFQGAESTLLCTWSRPGKPDRIEFGREVRIVNPLTSIVVEARSYELTVAPIMVLDPPESLVTQAKANLAKPFPWGGDYSQAKSVSIEFGETTVEQGLHTGSGADVAAAVIAYGGSARAGDVPGGNIFEGRAYQLVGHAVATKAVIFAGQHLIGLDLVTGVSLVVQRLESHLPDVGVGLATTLGDSLVISNDNVVAKELESVTQVGGLLLKVSSVG